MAGRDIRHRVDTGCHICDGFLQSAHDATSKDQSMVLLPSGRPWQNPNPPRLTPRPVENKRGAQKIRIEGHLTRKPENSDRLFPSSNPIGGGYHSHETGHCPSCGATIEVVLDHHGGFGHVEWTRTAPSRLRTFWDRFCPRRRGIIEPSVDKARVSTVETSTNDVESQGAVSLVSEEAGGSVSLAHNELDLDES